MVHEANNIHYVSLETGAEINVFQMWAANCLEPWLEHFYGLKTLNKMFIVLYTDPKCASRVRLYYIIRMFCIKNVKVGREHQKYKS